MSCDWCDQSVLGSHSTDVKGKCVWCGLKTDRAMPKPEPRRDIKSEDVQAYQYHWDPDYGNDRRDMY